ncbi:ribosome maturation factor RimP [Prauserella rugosa]|uniref:Ribosome maturation factor RimP n=1 Tax=Prauserella rugosa TaxID=43354 RepID=A0A660C7N8_9PSEU|nr:ribosome maturation factor RimP [Prauserella rugosa]KID30253.1 hypothetical protein HQ32_02505 [Prauserella sp. Am3]KMS83179.1 ribosome maturation factor RimP [Streptomyces regensis]TWH19590.1 ribosome maturation factor RimP [Prauserella rugosa]
MPNELASRLEPIVAEAVTAAGFDLDALDVQPAGRRKLVKVVVDSDDGVGLDEVAEVSRVLSGVLDEHEHLIAGAYTLEVTSPGVDRPLTAPRHWRRAKFRLVRVTPTEGAEFTGRVGDAGETAARMLVGGTIRDVHYSAVAKAVLEVEFKQPPADELKLLEQDAENSTDAGKDNSEGATGTPSATPKEEPR